MVLPRRPETESEDAVDESGAGPEPEGEERDGAEKRHGRIASSLKKREERTSKIGRAHV